MLHDGVHSGNNIIDGLAEPLRSTTLFLKEKLEGITPDYMVVLGSGLSTVLSSDVEILTSIKYSDIPGSSGATVSGHSGILELIKCEGKIVAVLRGRLHTYEGHSATDVVRTVRALSILGVKKAILTNAAGGTSLKHKPGTFILLKDHINMTGLTPLSSAEAKSIGVTFVDLSQPYSLKLRKEIKKQAVKLKIGLREGVYAWMPGPQYETASEVRMMKNAGVDVVGMSTVPEVIALNQLHTEVAVLSMVTNYGTGVKKDKKLSHEEVKEIGLKTANKLDNLLKSLIKAFK